MSRRRPSCSQPSSVAATQNTPRKQTRWLDRLLTKASSAGLSGLGGGRYGVESLEPRRMLTTFMDPDTRPIDQQLPDPFEYEAEGGGVMRIAYHDVTFEAIGVSVNPTTDATMVGDLIQAGITAPAAPILPFNLFTIYVTQSSADSWITVAPVTRQTATPPPGIRADQPFGTGTSIVVTPANDLGATRYAVTPGAEVGGGVLGAYTLAGLTADGIDADTPIDAVPDSSGRGVFPANAFGDNHLHAGFYVPDNATTGLPQDIETFKFAGEVFGNVEISGSIQLLYAGALLTGQALGTLLPQSPTSIPVYDMEDFPNISDPMAPNFTVGGDIHDLITTGDIGGDLGNAATDSDSDTSVKPNYDTGFYGVVGGKIGEIKDLFGGFYGHLTVTHSPSIAGISDATPEQELEYDNTNVYIVGDPGSIGQIFQGDTTYLSTLLPDQLPAPFTNDTPDTAQYLGTSQEVDIDDNLIVNNVGGRVYDTEVTGTLQDEPQLNFKTGDPADWYAISMLAGQTFTVSVTGGEQADILAEVQDPDGRLIASDATSTGVGVFQVKTDRPGIYRIGLLQNGTAAQGVNINYLLKLTGTGDQGLGVLATGGEISDMGVDGFLTVSNGDFGGIFTTASIVSFTDGPTPIAATGVPVFAPSSIIVAQGNLRSVTAAAIGSSTNGSTGVTISDPLYLSVPNGSVGLVRSTDIANGIIALETQFDPQYLSSGVFKTDDQYAHAIGGDIQIIDAATTFFGEIGTDGGIGTIHAEDMATTTPSYIDVNADNIGFDGIIDLIDVTGNPSDSLGFGILGGGPEFVTNQGGNVRYLDIPAGVPIYLPSAFGGELDLPVTYVAGSTQHFTDDSGSVYSATANGVLTVTSVTNASNGVATTVTTGPQITTVTYPVLDKAGLIPISISSSGSLTITASGTSGSASSVDVGSISFTGIGREITSSANVSSGVITGSVDTNNNPTLSQAVPTGGDIGVTTGPIVDDTDEFLSLGGSAKLNVLNVSATTSVAGNSPVEILNATQGEVVNIYSPGIGSIIVNGNLGFATPVATPAAVMPRSVITDGNTYPFVQQHTGVNIGSLPGIGFAEGTGNRNDQGSSVDGDASVVSIVVGGSVGNINAEGTIQSLVAGAHPITGQFNGISGPIVAYRLMSVSVGQGLLPTGFGLVGLSGLYAVGKIGAVTNSGNVDGDIRGNIVSGGEDPFSDTAIDSVSVFSASIIGSFIGTVENANFATTGALSTGLVVETNGENFGPNEPSYTYDIGPVRVVGLGGILGTKIAAGSIQSISVSDGGYGILSSLFDGQQFGRIGSISASGYGIRDTTVNGVGFLGPVTATGNGSLIPVTRYPVDVRPSDVPNTLDPFFGIQPDAAIDIDAVLGTTAATPNIANVTDTGVIQDDIFNGSRDFTSLTAEKTRTGFPLFNASLGAPSPSTADIPVIGNVYSNSISFGGKLGSVDIKQVTDGFQITVGQLGTISLGNDVNRIGISVAGNLKSLTVHGNLGQYITDPETGTLVPDSYINAGGPSGTITSLKVFGNMNANVYATGSIGSILITGDLLGGVLAYGKTNGQALGTLRVFGGIRDGALVLNGNVGSIIVNGTLGTAAGTLNIVGSVGLISVGANHRQKGSDLALALSVNGTIRSLQVNGQITGSVHTIGDISKLSVTGDGTAANIITGNLNIDGRIGTATITNGNIASSVIANGSITSFTLNRGSVLSTGTVESQIDSIHSFKITGGFLYGMYGSLIATNGSGDSIDISGNVGDTVDAAQITAAEGTTFHIRGSIQDHATIAVTFGLNLLEVDGNVAAGAMILAHPLKAQRIKGTNAGSITVV